MPRLGRRKSNNEATRSSPKRHSLARPYRSKHPATDVKKLITVVDLFCGCGGMSLGFQKAGFKIVAAFDNWQHAVDVYRENFEHPVFERDLSDSTVLRNLGVAFSYNLQSVAAIQKGLSRVAINA